MLSREEEATLARTIERLDCAVWEELLSYAPTTEFVFDHVDRACEQLDGSAPQVGEVRSAAAVARRSRSRRAHEQLRRAAARLAPELRAADLDRVVRNRVRAELQRASGSLHPVLPFRPNAPAFAAHLRKVSDAVVAASRARNAMVKANLRLVISVVRHWPRGELPFEDLIQSGNLGLLKAVDRFDVHRGFKFSTYATWWIRHMVSRAVADTGNQIRLPVYLHDARLRITRARRRLALNLGREPTPREIADEAGVPRERVDLVESGLPRANTSLDEPRTNGDASGEMQLSQAVADDAPTPWDELWRKTSVEQVQSWLLRLKPVQAEVVRRRFGLDDGEEETLQEIANSYGLSRERIRQLEASALARLRSVATSAESRSRAIARARARQAAP